MADLGPDLDTYWVTPGGLLAGEYPGDLSEERAIAKLDALVSTGVRSIVDLTEEGERALKPYAQLLDVVGPDRPEVEYRRMPIGDLSVPTRMQLREILDFVDGRLERGDVVYVHCWGGVGRTGVVVGCFLARHGYANGTSAIDRIAELRRDTKKAARESPETNEQRSMVVTWRQGD